MKAGERSSVEKEHRVSYLLPHEI